MTKSNIEDAFKMQRRILTGTGWWPKENPSLWYTLRGLVFYMSLTILGITMLMEVIKDLTDFTKLSGILYIMVTITAHIVKQTNLFFKRKTFLYTMELLRNPLFSSYPDDLDFIMANRNKFTQLVANIYWYITLVCITLMAITPILDKQPLPFPFSFELGRYRYVMFVFQAVAVCIGGWNHPPIDSLPGSLMGIAVTQLEILGYKIIRARDNLMSVDQEYKGTDDVHRQSIQVLKHCVKHHLVIIEYINCIERIFSFSILVQFLGSVIIVCNTLFHFILTGIGSGQFYMLVSYLGFLLAQLFMYCWFGNEVIWMSTKIGEACYFLNWYGCENEMGKYLFIIMERAKRPLKITVFKFSDLSLSSFRSIMQWSYSYFALLYNLYKKPK